MPIFDKQIIKPGTYTTRRKDGTTSRVYVGPQRIRQWVSKFRKMRDKGLQIPAPWRHEEKAIPIRLDGDKQDSDAYNNAGWWEDAWEASDGSLHGRLNVKRPEDAERIGPGGIDRVSLLAPTQWVDGDGDEYEDAITHIALVTHPVNHDQKSFTPAEHVAAALSLSLSALESTDDLTLGDPNDPTDPSSPEKSRPPVYASGANLSQALPILRELGIDLPDDTTLENLAERLVSAALAIKGHKDNSEEDGEGSITKPPPGSKQQRTPAPTAMNKELQFSMDLLQKSGVTNPQTDRPYTEAELVEAAKAASPGDATVKMSQEDQAAVTLAKRTLAKSYRDRVITCVKQGKISPKTAEDRAKPLLENLQLAFDAEGNQIPTALDIILESWEAIPTNSVLVGKTPLTAGKVKTPNLLGTGITFSMGVEEQEGGDFAPPTDSSEPITPEREEQVLHDQFRNSGHPELARQFAPTNN